MLCLLYLETSVPELLIPSSLFYESFVKHWRQLPKHNEIVPPSVFLVFHLCLKSHVHSKPFVVAQGDQILFQGLASIT
jgi:hypothetical protein